MNMWKKVPDSMVSFVWWYYSWEFWLLAGIRKQLGVFRGSCEQFRVLGKSHIVSKASKVCASRGLIYILEYM